MPTSGCVAAVCRSQWGVQGVGSQRNVRYAFAYVGRGRGHCTNCPEGAPERRGSEFLRKSRPLASLRSLGSHPTQQHRFQAAHIGKTRFLCQTKSSGAGKLVCGDHRRRQQTHTQTHAHADIPERATGLVCSACYPAVSVDLLVRAVVAESLYWAFAALSEPPGVRP